MTKHVQKYIETYYTNPGSPRKRKNDAIFEEPEVKKEVERDSMI